MSNGKIYEGKTTNEAIEIGLKDLKLRKEDVEIKVLENEDKRSFFSILSPRIVKVEITPLEKKQEKIREEKIEQENIDFTKPTKNSNVFYCRKRHGIQSKSYTKYMWIQRKERKIIRRIS